MESLGPGELKYVITQTCFFIKVRLTSYLEIRLLGLTMAVKPRPDKVKLKYGNTRTLLCGETRVWNPSDGASSELSGNTAVRPLWPLGLTQIW